MGVLAWASQLACRYVYGASFPQLLLPSTSCQRKLAIRSRLLASQCVFLLPPASCLPNPTQPKFAALTAAIAAGELQGNALIKLALQTLGKQL